jgi:L-amino acid N-acyltransferase YncA
VADTAAVTAPQIRPSTADDMGAISAIYAHHVLTGVATFEVDPPDPDEMLRRFHSVSDRGLPFLTALLDDEVVGYAYCSPWKSRPAYRHTVEDSVYIAPHAVGRRVGSSLLDALLEACRRSSVRQVIAVVVDADADASLSLHRRRGFVDAGRLSAVGFKHGRWLDTILLQRTLQDSDAPPVPPQSGETDGA